MNVLGLVITLLLAAGFLYLLHVLWQEHREESFWPEDFRLGPWDEWRDESEDEAA